MTAPNQPKHPKKPGISSKIKVFPLNPAQEAAAKAPISPLLIVAGAGTGKTRTLTSRILHFIEEGVSAGRICAITFTNKAAQEMKGRVAASAGPELLAGQEPLLSTFHSLGARILRKECRAVGRMPNFGIFDDHDSFDLIKKIVKTAVPKEATKKNPPAFFAQKISEIKNLGTGHARHAGEPPERIALIENVFAKYEDALMRNNAFDFDDLIQKPVVLFKKNPAILKKYQSMFDAILVDEYQDINPKQYELVKLLAGGHGNVSVVGDDEQTIYSWRYADIRTFLDFDKEWPGAKVHFLEENYRSTGTIIRAAGAVAENNRFRTPKKLRTGNPAGEPIALFEAWGENDEAVWIAGEIEKIRRGEPQPEIAILYRTNAQSRAIEQALIRHDIPYQIFGGLKFYERREVKDAVAALRWASNSRDEVAKERLEKNLSKRKFALFRERALKEQDPRPENILKIFLEAFAYFDYLDENFLNAGERQENITELLGFASSFDDLADFLEKISLLQATDDQVNEHPDTLKKPVALMTIHLAKGLEFDNVFIAGAAEGLLPHIRSIDNESSLEEERRLMYVAMTRAKKKLCISFYGMPSRFIAEIPADCIALAEGSAGSGRDDEDDTGDSDDGGSAFEENVVRFD